MTPPRPLSGPPCYLGLPAPAKVNWFLHILGRRTDGYHEIQSVFVPVDLCDTVDMESRPDGRIVREGDLTGPVDGDLAVRAAVALQGLAVAAQPAGAVAPGVTLAVHKRIPVGAGLGGGSSDAATTLIGLDRLWNLSLGRSALAQLARKLGADVPFFLGGGAAFVEGIGEQSSPLHLAPAWLVLVYPQVHVSTAEIFSDPKLTRDSKRTTIAGFSAALHDAVPAAGSGPGQAAAAALFGANDLEAVVRARCPAVDAAIRVLDACGGPGSAARMSGSGSAVFRVLAGAAEAQQLLQAVRERMPAQWTAWAVATLPALPLAEW